MLDKGKDQFSAEQTEMTSVRKSQETQEDQEQDMASENAEIVEEDHGDPEISILKEQCEGLQKTIESMQNTVATADDKVLRAYAEMENIRRRSQKDVESAHKFALEKFVNGLLPVIDSMEKATETAVTSNEEKAMLEGVDLTLKMLVDTLQRFGVEQINPIDEVFDPNQHEAMAMAPDPGKENNTILDVFQKGYVLNQRVIRPARVIVVKNQ